MISWLRSVIRRLQGERRHAPRLNAEKVEAVNRQYAVAVRLGRKLDRDPEDLLGREDVRRLEQRIRLNVYRHPESHL